MSPWKNGRRELRTNPRGRQAGVIGTSVRRRAPLAEAIGAARKLGELERKKQDLIRTSESKEGKIALSHVVKARHGWIRTVRAFVSIIELEKNLAGDIRQRILGPLEEAERRAGRRGGKESNDEAIAEDTGSEAKG
jgi:hypothetical protein